MRTYKYIGLFKNAAGNEYTLEVSCNGYLQAMILLTADAIRSSRHYQLSTITDEKGNIKHIDNILKMHTLIL